MIYRNCNFFNWINLNWICSFISHTYIFYYWLNPNISMSQKIPCCKSLKTAECLHRPNYSVRVKVWTGSDNPYLNYVQIIPTDRLPISYCVNCSTMFQENIRIKTKERLFLYLFFQRHIVWGRCVIKCLTKNVTTHDIVVVLVQAAKHLDAITYYSPNRIACL